MFCIAMLYNLLLQSWLTGTYFRMLCFSYMSALWILIGSLHCLCSLWLATSVCPEFSFNTPNWKLLYNVYPSHWSRALFKEGHGPQDAKKMLISKTSFRSRENVRAGTKISFCNNEVSGTKQVSIKWDLTNSSFNFVTCTGNNILHDILRLDCNKWRWKKF